MNRSQGERDNPMILITGAGGRVGRLLERHLQARYPDRVVAATREELDLTDAGRLSLEMERLEPRPTAAINCAAQTDAREAESDPVDSLGTNREGVANLARACREIGCRIIHVSTADIFDGHKTGPYVEEDLPAPRTQYGRIRYLGELAAAQGNPDHLVLRLSLVCGDGEPEDPVQVIRGAMESGSPLTWDDRRVSPIFAEDLASALGPILRSEWRGVLHLANGGSCLLSELAAESSRHLGAQAPPKLTGGPGPASFWEGGGANAALDARRFAFLTGRRLRDWRAALSAHFAPGSGA